MSERTTRSDRTAPAERAPQSRVRVRSAGDGMLTQLVRARRLGPRAVDAVRANIERDSRLGIGYLGVGAVIVGIILIGRGLVSLGWTWPENDARLVSAAAWVVVIAAFAAAVLVARRGRGVLPLGWFIGVLSAGALALGIDQASALLGRSDYLTVSIGVGATLLACVTFRPVGQILVATLALTAVLLAGVIAIAVTQPGNAGLAMSQLVLTVMPVFAGIIVVRSFGQLVQRELDRTVAESTITAPRYGLGLLASAELARLDLAAEELLQDVAAGRVELPLDRTLAGTAASLATDLRRMLVAGRTETWLMHAITDSEYLATAVTVDDPDGLAGYLEPEQRDGLLSAIWLVLDESGRSSPTIRLAIARPGAARTTAPEDRMVLPIAVSVEGVPRRRIDPAVWSALSRVGQYSVETRTGRLRVSVDAHVTVPDAAR